MSSEYDTNIKMQAENLALHKSRRGVCPSCNSNKGFAMTRTDDEILYICHRASCGIKGRVSVKRNGVIYLPKTPSPKQNWKSPKMSYLEFVEKSGYESIPITPDVWYRMVNDKGIQVPYGEAAYQQVRYSPKTNRLIFPLFMFGSVAEPQGFQAFNSRIQPKAMTFRLGNPSLPLHFRPRGLDAGRKKVVLVEDILSAMQLQNAGIPAVALLGIHLPAELASYLANLFPNAIVMLDHDAQKQAQNILKNYKHLMEIQIVSPPKNKDPKHMTKKELNEMYKNSYTKEPVV